MKDRHLRAAGYFQSDLRSGHTRLQHAFVALQGSKQLYRTFESILDVQEQHDDCFASDAFIVSGFLYLAPFLLSLYRQLPAFFSSLVHKCRAELLGGSANRTLGNVGRLLSRSTWGRRSAACPTPFSTQARSPKSRALLGESYCHFIFRTVELKMLFFVAIPVKNM